MSDPRVESDPAQQPEDGATPAAPDQIEEPSTGPVLAEPVAEAPVAAGLAAEAAQSEPVATVPAEARAGAAPETTTDAAPAARRRRAKPAPNSGTQPAPAPKPYAVVKTGGKQYRVSVGDRISVERLADEAGGEITLDQVLLLGGDGTTRVGTPTVAGAAVTATVDDHFRGEKLVIFKYKAKKRYRRRTGHRQSLTHLTITGISG